MTFPYQEYYECLFQWPLVMFAFAIFAAFREYRPVTEAVKQVKQHWGDIKKSAKYLIEIFVATLGIMAFFCVSVHQLRYGIPLARERNAEPQTITGYVEEIQEDWSGIRFHYQGRQERGDVVIISGSRYFFITSGNLCVGDYIEISYLPNSKVVLQCSMADETGIFGADRTYCDL